MPRFSAAFARRKSTADELQNVDLTEPQRPLSTFRVLERNDYNGKSFDGGARMARSSTTPIPKPSAPDHTAEDNMFANLQTNNRGASHTTKATSADNSSRHSNASTAPSSADMGGANGHNEGRDAGKKAVNDARATQKSGTSSFLNRAGRTFSFGVQKKNTVPPPQDDFSNIPPVPAEYEDEYARQRGMTASTASTATPPKLEGGSGMDMGGDFGSMFNTFDKRASNSTLKNLGSPTPRALTGNRTTHPAPLALDNSVSVDPSPQSWNSQNSNENLLGSNATSPEYDRPPPVPRHQSSLERQASRRPTDLMEDDEDSKLLQDSLLAGRFLSGPSDFSSSMQAGRRRTEEDSFTVLPRKPIAASFAKGEDNMFDGSLSRLRNASTRPARQSPSSSQTKVMTTVEFEKYRQDKERQERLDKANKVAGGGDDEDEVNYDEEEEEDEAERQKQLAKQRRKQQAHMSVYRQQMMKVTGEQAMPSPPPTNRPGLQTSMSAPHIMPRKSPSPDPSAIPAEEDEDEDVPLAILQAHGFPSKNRAPSRLSTVGSNPNLRASAAPQPARPGSSLGEGSTSGHQRHSTLPAFARGLPQDPFVGAGISKPAVRESLSFSGGSQHNQQSSGAMPPGGLVGVIANEERSRAMRRGSPNVDNQKISNGGMAGQPGFDPAATIPHHMMYGGRNSTMPGMPGMPQQQMLSAGDQAQIQMTQQMQHFMQMQMQFMQMMASGQGNGAPPMQPPYGAMPGSQSVADLSRQSMMGDPMAQPRPLDPGMRTMSMVQPPGMQFMPQHGMAPSIHIGGPGYSPSIAPSERSNVGLPGRYRPVSQAGNPGPALHQRASTMSGALGQWDDPKGKPSVRVVSRAAEGSDDDDEEGWEAMKAARDQKMAERRGKKNDFIPGF